jgi:hypothetical protein
MGLAVIVIMFQVLEKSMVPELLVVCRLSYVFYGCPVGKHARQSI